MQNKIIQIFTICLSGLLILSHALHAQTKGIDISSGANISTTGSATIEITDGDFLNNGTFTTSTGNTVTMKGTSAESIGGSAATTFYNLTIDNSTGVTLNSNSTINNNLVINSGKKFTVGAGKALAVTGTITNSAGNTGFVLKSDATGTASLIHNTGSVPATVQRYIIGAAEDWHFLSSPVSAQSISGSWLPSGTYGNGTGYDLYLWYEPTSCWIYKLNTTSTDNWNTAHPGADFVVGRGYLYSVQAVNPVKEFAGNLNNGTINYGLTFASDTVRLKGFNLVGNPYPSTIDWKAASGWTRTKLKSTGGGYDMWIWNPAANNYGIYNSADADGIGTNSVTRYIASMQGYFVQASEAGNLSMTNSVRLGDATISWIKGDGFKEAEIIETQEVSKVSLTVKSEAGYGFDEIQLKFGYSENENGAIKLFSRTLTAPSLYMASEESNLSVHYFTDTNENPVVPVRFKAGVSGKYTIECNFDPAQYETVMLEDRQIHYFQNLKVMKNYTFKASEIDDANRFVLHFGPEKNPAGNNDLPGKVYCNANQLIIDLTLVSRETELFVYDLTGRILLQQKLQGEIQHSLDFKSETKILIVFLRNPDGSLSHKLFWAGN